MTLDPKLPKLIVRLVKYFVCAILMSVFTAAADEARVLTFNIRCDNPADGANAWPHRKDAVAKLIRENADVAGLQEVRPGQRAWLEGELKEFGFVGVERDRGGEAVPVVYRRDRFEVLASGTFWLSDTPEQAGSSSWGNQIPRICTWARLRDLRDGAIVRFYNVHLDHESAEAREKGLALVADRLGASDEPAVLLGDFNCRVGDAPLAKLAAREKFALRSTYDILKAEPEGTFHGFRGQARGSAIDFIFLDPSRWKVANTLVMKTTYTATEGEARYVSDHFPVSAKVAIAK